MKYSITCANHKFGNNGYSVGIIWFFDGYLNIRFVNRFKITIFQYILYAQKIVWILYLAWEWPALTHVDWAAKPSRAGVISVTICVIFGLNFSSRATLMKKQILLKRHSTNNYITVKNTNINHYLITY